MASYGKFQNNYSRYAGSQNSALAPKVMVRELDRVAGRREKIIDWVTFYRRNLHRFVEHYLGIKLFPYQVIWLYYMSTCDSFVTVASRASAKSWLIAVLAVCRAILYPNSEIVIVATTMKQAAIIFGKIRMLKNDYDNINREISSFSDSAQKIMAEFHNGSKIKVVACNEQGRGERSCFTIGEEFRIMNKEKFDSIVKPFAYVRQAPYMKLPEYANDKRLIEEPKEMLISSAYYKAEWWYNTTIETIKMLLRGKKVGFIALDYLIALEHNIKTQELIDREKETMDAITFQQEYLNIPFGENADAFFKLEMFKKRQNIKKAFYPQKLDEYNPKGNPYCPKKTDGELRVVSVDVATRKGSKNDNTVICCTRLFPTNRGYEREIVYMETFNGENIILQAKRIKQIFYDFDSNYLVLDFAQAGISIYDQLGLVTKDEERGVEYPAWTVLDGHGIDSKQRQELQERTLSLNAIPVVFPIQAYAQLNNDAAFSLRNKIQTGMLSFLIAEGDADEYLSKTNKDYKKVADNIYEKLWYLHPYAQVTETINEMVSLSMKLLNGLIQLKEPSHGRKDRYTAVAYMNYFVDILDISIIKEEGDNSIKSFMQYYAQKKTKSKTANAFKFR